MPLVGLMVWVIGMAQGAEADFIAFFALRSFGMRAFSTIVGVLGTVGTIGLSLGAFLYGYLFDLYGSYVPACHLGASCLVAGGVLVLIAGAGEQRVPRTA